MAPYPTAVYGSNSTIQWRLCCQCSFVQKKNYHNVQQAYQILRRELKIYRAKRQSDPAAIISFEHLLKIQPGAWCTIPDRQVAIIEERFVHDDEVPTQL